MFLLIPAYKVCINLNSCQQHKHDAREAGILEINNTVKWIPLEKLAWDVNDEPLNEHCLGAASNISQLICSIQLYTIIILHMFISTP